MKKLILALLLLTSISIANPLSFGWVDSDKQSHMAINYFLTDLGKERFNMTREQCFEVLLLIDVAKEVVDYASYGVFDVNDIVAGKISTQLDFPPLKDDSEITQTITEFAKVVKEERILTASISDAGSLG